MPAGPSLNLAEMVDDPHLNARGFFVDPEHPVTGKRRLEGIPWKSSACEPVFEHAPLLGQDNYYIFQNTGVPYQPNTKYTLTVGVGNRNTGFSPAGSLSIVGLTVLNEPPSSSNFLQGFNANDQLLVDDVLAAVWARLRKGPEPDRAAALP